MVFGKSLLGAPSGSSPTRTSARNGLRRSVRRIRGIDPGQSRSRQPEYARRLLPPRLLLDVVPNLGGGEVLAAEGMRVDLRGGGDGRVAEAFADSRQVHAFLQQKRCMAVAHGVERCALGA